MTPEERQLLSGLFDRIQGAAGAPRDKDAEAFIADAVRQSPHAAYVLSQTVIVQEEALKAAASRIQELEGQVAEAQRQAQAGSSSFLGGIGKSLFGGAEPPRPAPAPVPSRGSVPPTGPWGQPQQPPPGQAFNGPQGGPPQGGPWGGQPQGGPWGGQQPQPPQQPAGGGFLRSAMATAAGVAGGALLFQGISSLFNNHHGANGLLSGQGMTDPINQIGNSFPGAGSGGSFGSGLADRQPEADTSGSSFGSGLADRQPQADTAGYDDPGVDTGYDDAGYDDGGSDDSWA